MAALALQCILAGDRFTEPEVGSFQSFKLAFKDNPLLKLAKLFH